jgi:enoyl-[acyl-carrier protein] reductase III
MSLKGKYALITGGSRGIGRSIALALAEYGCNIFINYVANEQAALEVKSACEAKGVKAHIVLANVGNPAEIKTLFGEIKKHSSHLDILVHNAALGAFKPLMKLRENHWDLSMNVNAKAFLQLAQEAVPMMPAGGRIIGLSSLGSHQYIPNYGAIGISKAAVEDMVRYMAVELAEKDIRVNCVSGGLVDTDALKAFPTYTQMVEEGLKHTPLKRLGKPEDLATVVRFLCTPDSDWITGQTIVVDGGLSLI